MRGRDAATRVTRVAALLVLAACSGPTDDTGSPPPDTGPDVPVGEIVDPLSMPFVPTLSVDDFNPARDCASCHPDHYEQWSTSNHAYAMIDPLFQELTLLRQQEFDGAQDRFCHQCHSAIGVRGGEITPNFSYDALSEVVMEGVTCESCHKVTAIDRDHNSGHVLDAAAPEQGPLADAATNAFHTSAPSTLHEDAEFCGACHDVVELGGVALERPYEEWLESPSAQVGQTCQACHMPPSTGAAAAGGEPRTVHDHRFVGVDLPFAEGFLTEAEATDRAARIEALLTGVAEVRIDAAPAVPAGDTLDLVVTVANLLQGHNLPTGTTFIREMWLEAVVTDARGDIVFETGTLDEDGDLRGYWSALDPYGDTELVTFHSGLIDSDGEPTIFPWRATEHWSGAIPPLYERTNTWFVDTSSAVGPLQVSVRLRFRPLAPHVLRAVGLDAEAGAVPVYDLAEAAAEVALTLDAP